MAKGDKRDVASAKAAASKKKATNQFFKEIDKRGVARAAGSQTSARMPSVASKANAKNKMKAQGAKIGTSATSGYGKKGKK